MAERVLPKMQSEGVGLLSDDESPPSGNDKTTAEGLQRVLKPLHMRYSQRINRARGWQGHVWQGRFFSSPLDEAHLWARSISASDSVLR